MEPHAPLSSTQMVWQQFRKHPIGMAGACIVFLFALIGLYAPFLAASKPFVVVYDGQIYFPLFRYLFYAGYYTKPLDLFFNLAMFTLPLGIGLFYGMRGRSRHALSFLLIGHFLIFLAILLFPTHDPSSSPELNKKRQEATKKQEVPLSWQQQRQFMTSYAQLNEVLRYHLRKTQHERLLRYESDYLALRGAFEQELPTLYSIDRENERQIVAYQQQYLNRLDKEQKLAARVAKATIAFVEEKLLWLEEQEKHLSFVAMPLLRDFHWEDDAGGEQSINTYVDWWELTRTNRKDLVAGLLFGIRISLVVGILAVTLQLLIGIPIGSLAGYFGGKFDIFVSRLLEIWEGMPTFFMLLLVVAVTQNKSIFLVILVLGLFGWTGTSRFIRGEVLKQRNLSYVEACRAIGFPHRRILFSHILPNALPPILTLLPFAVMAAITSEAGLSFLGLGEEGSCSWGVLMDEGRQAFPGESYLLWPPALLLTTLLIAIALVGDALRDAMDPKMR